MSAINQALNLGDLLKYEDDCLNFSRDQVTVASGQNLDQGVVVGLETLTGKYKVLDPAATNGTEVARGVLLFPVDATLIDKSDGVILARHGIVASSAVVWPAGITTEQKAAAIAALELRGILIRQSA